MVNEMRNHTNTMRNEHYFLPVNKLAFKLKICLYLGTRVKLAGIRKVLVFKALQYIYILGMDPLFFDEKKIFMKSQVYNLVQRMCVVICRELLG